MGLTLAGWPICISKDGLDRYLALADSGDKAALDKLIGTGECGLSRADVKVHVEGSAGLGRYEIRPEGETSVFLTLTEALRPTDSEGDDREAAQDR